MKTHANMEGFTLVEMLVVLTLMAILMVVSLPYAKGSGEARILDAAAQSLAARLRETQAAAISSNSERNLTVDLKAGSIVQHNPERIFNLPAGTAIKILTAQNEVVADTASIRFFANGGASGGMIMLSKGSHQVELDINWLSGAVVITQAKPQ
jgi:general secretion pathway protein H